MGGTDVLNPQVVDALSVARDATLCPKVIMIEGKGKAYQAVAQSVSIAIQDATDYLRNISTVSATAQGVAMAKILETKDVKQDYAKAIAAANTMVVEAAGIFKSVGDNAATVLEGFVPKGP